MPQSIAARRGTRDRLPEDAPAWERVEAVAPYLQRLGQMLAKIARLRGVTSVTREVR